MQTRTKYLPLFVCLAAALACAEAKEDVTPSYYPQEVRYAIEGVAEAYIAWGIDGWSHTEESSWNEKTFVHKNLLLTPLQYVDGRLRTEIDVPLGATIDFCFWVTKTHDGQIIDVWDPQAHHVRANNQGPMLVASTLGAGGILVKDDGSGRRWRGLLVCLSLLVGGVLALRLLQPGCGPPTYHQEIVLTAVSLYAFHFLVRLEIQNFSVAGLSYAIPGLGAPDLAYILVLAGAFLLLGSLLHRPAARRRLSWAFNALAAFSLAAAFINIRVLETLGHPFNYRWLYYSDFLGSTEAQAAMFENTSWVLIATMVAMCAAMFLAARLSMVCMSRLRPAARAYPAAYLAIIVLVGLTLALGRSPRLEKVGTAKLANPVAAFVLSVLKVDPQANLFSLQVPASFVRTDRTQVRTTAAPGTVTNVILVVLESAGARYFDLYGGQHQITPVLNENFAHSILFENVYAHAPASNKALVSLMCSMYPMISYQSLTQENPDFDCPSLSSEFAGQGYRTAFFSSSNFTFQSADKFLAKRSFDVVEDFDEIRCEHEFRLQGGDEGYYTGIDDACLATRLAGWIDQDRTRPFFAMLWTNQGHYPYFSSTKEKDFKVKDVYFNSYLNALHHYDETIGIVIADLKTRGLFESTLIAIVGDHGEAFGQHGEGGHGSGIYEENLRVPLLLVNPRLFTGQRKTELVGLIDLAPTLLQLADKPVPEQWQGRSVFSTEREPEAFFFAPWSNFLFGTRQGNQKVIFDETRSRVELYDLAADPLEAHNIAAEHPERVEALRFTVAAWVQQQKARRLEK